MATAKSNSSTLTIFAIALLAAPGSAFGEAPAPRPGDVQTLTVITLSLRVGSTEKESKTVTYTPPPGWYIRSHAVDCSRRQGNSSFAVSTVPAQWAWSSAEKAEESDKHLVEATLKAREAGLQGRLKRQRAAALGQSRQATSSHHALVLDATAKGEGLFHGGGALELTVTAELVYGGTDEAPGKDGPQQVATLK